MRFLFFLTVIISLYFPANLTNAQNIDNLSINYSNGELLITANSEFHKAYGLAFPVTYILDIPGNNEGLSVYERHSTSQSWIRMVEKTPTDTFNDIEAVRFDYLNQTSYVSAAFEEISDSIYLKVTDKDNNKIAVAYKGISKYYDNRHAAVTITFDDFADWTLNMVPPLVNLFREHGLYLTAGIITAGLGKETWAEIQSQLDEGYFEVASHSRSHSHTPYKDPAGEITGSFHDITDNLNLPEIYKVNGEKYVYVWIAPYGDYDAITDSLLGTCGYLAARLYKNLPLDDPREYIYGDSSFSNWNESSNHFNPFFPSVELGAPSWGGGDTSLASLNNLFDSIAVKGGIYHLMWHPQVLFPDIDKYYLNAHLEHISNRKDIWYVCLGNLYLYHLLQIQNVDESSTGIAKNELKPAGSFNLLQNYPNPFNPDTKIRFIVQYRNHVIIKLFNILGKEVSEITDLDYNPGKYEINLKGDNLSSGIYFCRMQCGKFFKTIKIVLEK